MDYFYSVKLTFTYEIIVCTIKNKKIVHDIL